MKVKIKKDIGIWQAGQIYLALPFILDKEEGVKVNFPGTDICIFLKWEEVEVVE